MRSKVTFFLGHKRTEHFYWPFVLEIDKSRRKNWEKIIGQRFREEKKPRIETESLNGHMWRRVRIKWLMDGDMHWIILLTQNRFNPFLIDGNKRLGKQRRHQRAIFASNLSQIMKPAEKYVLQYHSPGFQ